MNSNATLKLELDHCDKKPQALVEGFTVPKMHLWNACSPFFQ